MTKPNKSEVERLMCAYSTLSARLDSVRDQLINALGKLKTDPVDIESRQEKRKPSKYRFVVDLRKPEVTTEHVRHFLFYHPDATATAIAEGRRGTATQSAVTRVYQILYQLMKNKEVRRRRLPSESETHPSPWRYTLNVEFATDEQDAVHDAIERNLDRQHERLRNL